MTLQEALGRARGALEGAPAGADARIEEALAPLEALGPDGAAFRRAAAATARVVAGRSGEAADDLRGVLLGALDDVLEASGDDAESRTLVLRTAAERLDLFLPTDPAPAAAVRAGFRYDRTDPAELDLFVAEAREVLDAVEDPILRLAGEPAAVDEAFRAFHTVKGAAGMLGLDGMSRLTHAAEETLESVRSGRLRPSAGLEEALLAAKDRLAEIVRLIEDRGDPEVDVETAVAAVRAAAAGEAGPEGDASAATGASAAGGAGAGAARAGGTVRIEATKLDEIFDRMGESVAGRTRLEACVARLGLALEERGEESARREAVAGAFETLALALEESGRTQAALQDRVMSLRLAPIGTVFRRFPRVVQQTARRLGKQVAFEASGGEVEIDKGICEALVEPFIHIIRNAVDHGIEPPEERMRRGKDPEGRLLVSAAYRGDRVVVEVLDDGRGIDPERVAAKALSKGLVTREELDRMDERARCRLVFRAGFSTAEEVSDLSGRGVGMDVVREVVERLKGTVDIETEDGAFTRIILHLPLTLALVDLLLVEIDGRRVALPLYLVAETLRLPAEEITSAGDRPVVPLRDAYLPLISLAGALGLPREVRGDHVPLVVVEAGGDAVALEVSRLHRRFEAVMKPLGPLLAGAPFVSGATILGDGSVVPVIDPVPILRRRERAGERAAGPAAGAARRALVVDDSRPMAAHLAGILRRAGFDVEIAADGEAAIQAVRKTPFDVVSTDIEMPRMDGYEFCRRMREDPKLESIPVIAASSHAEKIDRIKGFEAGFDEYLTKPVDEAVFLATIERLLARRKAPAP